MLEKVYADGSHRVYRVEIVPDQHEAPNKLINSRIDDVTESDKLPDGRRRQVFDVKIYIKQRHPTNDNDSVGTHEDVTLLELEEVRDEPVDMNELQATFDEIIRQQIEKQDR